MKSIRKTTTHIDPKTGKPVIAKTIITKKGNKKAVIAKEKELVLVPIKHKTNKKSHNPEKALLKDIEYRKLFPMKKGISTKKMPIVDDIWSEVGKQVLKDYRSYRAKFRAETTETYMHSGFTMAHPGKAGYYQVKRTVKLEFKPLPLTTLTANEKIDALRAHKAVQALRRADKKTQRTDAKTLAGKIPLAFDKDSYSAKLQERIANRGKQTKRMDNLTISFRGHIPKALPEPTVKVEEVKEEPKRSVYKPFIVAEFKQHTTPSGHKMDSPYACDYADSLEEARAKADDWKQRSLMYESNKPSKVIVFGNYKDPVKSKKAQDNPLYILDYNKPMKKAA